MPCRQSCRIGSRGLLLTNWIDTRVHVLSLVTEYELQNLMHKNAILYKICGNVAEYCAKCRGHPGEIFLFFFKVSSQRSAFKLLMASLYKHKFSSVLIKFIMQLCLFCHPNCAFCCHQGVPVMHLISGMAVVPFIDHRSCRAAERWTAARLLCAQWRSLNQTFGGCRAIFPHLLKSFNFI